MKELKEELNKLVEETNEMFKLDNFKELIPKIAENTMRINKLAESLNYKVFLKIDDLNLKEII